MAKFALTTYEIALQPKAQIISVTLGDKTYSMRLIWCDTDEGGWLLSIADAQGNALVSGIPLVGGADLLEQYSYLEFGGMLFCLTDGDPLAAPTYENLGVHCHLTWVPLQ